MIDQIEPNTSNAQNSFVKLN